MRDPLARRKERHAYTFTDALRVARAAWPDADDIGEAAAAAMDAWDVEDESDDE